MKTITKTLLSALFFSVALGACQSQVPDLLDFEICDDNRDNNGDGLFDCSDEECRTNDPVCARPERCDDNLDNDFNGVQDCQDDACAGAAECLCIVTNVVQTVEFPFIIEGDSADGVPAINLFGCQTGDALDSFFNLVFLGANRVDILLEPLDDVAMVLQTTDDCGDNEFASCNRNSDAIDVAPLEVRNFDVSGGATLFFVGAREAGQTGRFRLTFTEAE